jgi:nitrite reductase (NADH) small subunit
MTTNWIKVCKTDDILPNSGVAALVSGLQIAIFRLQSEFYAISDYDPFSGAYVLSRGIVGDRAGVIKVSSPIYKQSFNLLTGECLDDPSVKLPTYPVQVVDDGVYISTSNSEYVVARMAFALSDEATPSY